MDKPLTPVGTSPLMINIDKTGKTDKVSIMVIINSNAFEVIDGITFRDIEVPIENKDIGPFLFLVKSKQEGLQSITLNFFQDGFCIGSIEVNTFVESGNIESDPEQSTRINSFKGTLLSNKLLGSDVTIVIQEVKTNPNFEYKILFYSKDTPWTDLGPLIFPFNPESKFRDIFKDIENSNLPANIVDDKVKSKGLLLYDELFPDRLKDLYWKIKDSIKTVQIVSTEPWIPWEIIKPYRRLNDGKIEEDLFLSEKFAISRWISNKNYNIKKKLAT
ncbi:MAG: hypothetical protein P0116_15135 [Candidatus Nitrosocosmicus sp.]|nr:hypothetical protein [Candidatus Nitrosocosmicus sp.]